MKKELFPIFLLFLFLFLAFPEQRIVVRYRCLDGSITNDVSLCPQGKGEEEAPGAIIVIKSQSNGEHSLADVLPDPIPEVPERQAKLIKHIERISDSEQPKYDPSVDGNVVAWVEFNGKDTDIHLKLLNSNRLRKIASSDFDEHSPRVAGNEVVYVEDVTPLKPKQRQNDLMLYDVLLDEDMNLVCIDGRKTLIDFQDDYVLYTESFLEQNRVMDISLLRDWNCEQPKFVKIPEGEKPIKVITRNYLLVAPKSARECRILDLGTQEIHSLNLPCLDIDEKLAVNDRQYFDWKNFSTVYQYRNVLEEATDYPGYAADYQRFVLTDNHFIVLQLPDIKVSSITYERPEYDLVLYDVKNKEAVPITKTMKRKEELIHGTSYWHDFDFSDEILVWVDIREDENKPELYVAKFGYG
ncbi:hypothetical protein HYS48_00135 [Candidatus Woesearchaeota archaeon]|nr:hypothetical protein [Candidatus Woesearchaeota archaeon]